MNQSRLDYLKKEIEACHINGEKVLEVGSRNINGSIRPLIESYNPASYLGVDIEPGEGVDEIVSVYKLWETYSNGSFDVVVCCETLEHLEDWKVALVNMWAVLKPLGLFILSVPDETTKYHGYPNDFWRFTKEDFKIIFGATMGVSEHYRNGVFFIGHKTGPVITDLEIKSILTGKRMGYHKKWHIKYLSIYRQFMKQPMKTIIKLLKK